MNMKVHGGVRPGWLFAFFVFLVSGCAGYVPGRQAYWDAQVRKMCEEDGGVTVYQKVRVSRADLDRHVLPMAADGRISFAPRELAHPEAPIYSEERVTVLSKENPRVNRRESVIVRRLDNVIVARWVTYARVGGDFPVGVSEGSAFICPDLRKMATDLHRQLFIVDGDLR